MERWDAITIGGGLAGAVFALKLAEAGYRVLVLEKTRSAHHKVCGEFISSESLGLLQSCGVDVIRLGAARPEIMRLIAGRIFVDTDIPFEGAGFSRFRLDQELLNRAEQAGATIRRGVTATAVGRHEDELFVETRDTRYTASWIGYASGKFNVKGTGFANFDRPGNSFVGFKMMATLSGAAASELANRVQLMSYPGGYQGMQMVEDAQCSICWITRPCDAKKLGVRWNSHAAFLSRQSNLVGDVLQGTTPCWENPIAISVPPFGFLRQKAITAGLYPLGDQMAVIPSFTGDGMAVALASGLLAANCIIDGRTDADYVAKAGKILALQFRLARAAHAAILNPTTRWAGIRVLAAAPGLAKYLACATRLPGELIDQALSMPKRVSSVG